MTRKLKEDFGAIGGELANAAAFAVAADLGAKAVHYKYKQWKANRQKTGSKSVKDHIKSFFKSNSGSVPDKKAQPKPRVAKPKPPSVLKQNPLPAYRPRYSVSRTRPGSFREWVELEEYNKDAVQKEINKDKRIKGAEAKKIHSLLKGWRGSKADSKKKLSEGWFRHSDDHYSTDASELDHHMDNHPYNGRNGKKIPGVHNFPRHPVTRQKFNPWKGMKEVKDGEGDVTHWEGIHNGTKITIWND